MQESEYKKLVSTLIEPNIGQKTIDCIIDRLDGEDRTTSDTIYRQDAIDCVSEMLNGIFVEHEDIAKKAIGKLPSAHPTQTNADSTQSNTLDCVSRKQAIDGIKKEILKGDRRFYKGLLVANHVIVQLPPVQPEVLACGSGELVQESGDLVKELVQDCVSRQEAVTLPVMPKRYRKYQTNNLDDAYEQGWEDLQKCIERLAIAQTERKKGKWISIKGSNGKDYHKCSECLHTQEITGVKNYCAVCGADMRGESDV